MDWDAQGVTVCMSDCWVKTDRSVTMASSVRMLRFVCLHCMYVVFMLGVCNMDKIHGILYLDINTYSVSCFST